eukprot:7792889-Karenia_brevis.AAC.1
MPRWRARSPEQPQACARSRREARECCSARGGGETFPGRSEQDTTLQNFLCHRIMARGNASRAPAVSNSGHCRRIEERQDPARQIDLPVSTPARHWQSDSLP